MTGNDQRKLLFTAERFRVERVTTQLYDGTLFSREIVRHPGAVVILPILDDGRICLIRNYRLAVERELLELPAGTRELNERAIKTAERELAEETGYTCQSIRPLCEFYMSPGILDEHMSVFVATGLTHGAPALEVGEQIVAEAFTVDQIDEMICSGKMVDSKSIAALLYYFRYHASKAEADNVV